MISVALLVSFIIVSKQINVYGILLSSYVQMERSNSLRIRHYVWHVAWLLAPNYEVQLLDKFRHFGRVVKFVFESIDDLESENQTGAAAG